MRGACRRDLVVVDTFDIFRSFFIYCMFGCSVISHEFRLMIPYPRVSFVRSLTQ